MGILIESLKIIGIVWEGFTSISLTNWIQILIAIVLLATAIFSYKLFRLVEKFNELKLFTSLMAEVRKINIEIFSYELPHNPRFYLPKQLRDMNKAARLRLNFYEYLSIIIFKGEINTNLLLSYFGKKIPWAYFAFMDPHNDLGPWEQKTGDYPYLSELFNQLGLSVKDAKDINLPSGEKEV